jgi:hypothetical protein
MIKVFDVSKNYATLRNPGVNLSESQMHLAWNVPTNADNLYDPTETEDEKPTKIMEYFPLAILKPTDPK